MNRTEIAEKAQDTGFQPLYLRVCDSLRQYMNRSEVKKRGKLPAEQELSRELGIGRNTLRHALAILEKEGLVKRVKNRGTLLCSEMHVADPYSNALTVGILFPHTGHWKNVLDMLRKKVLERNYKFRLYLYSWNDLEDEKDTFAMARRECSGLFLHPHMRSLDRNFIEKVVSERYPVVLFGSIYENIGCNVVGLDNFQAGYRLTQMMLEEGRRKIVFINERYDWLPPVSQRISGYKNALEDAGLEFDERNIINPYVSDEGIERFIMRTGPDGIISSTPNYAFSAMSVLIGHGKKIPEDVRLARFGELLELPDYKDSMLVVSTPEEIFCEKLATVMFECVHNPGLPAQRIYINPFIKLNT